MRLPRRQFVHLVAAAAITPALPPMAMAVNYPARPVRIIVGFPPGTSPDIIARLLGDWLSERLGQPFIIDKRSGAASNIATEFVAASAPDGYTLFIPVSTNAINATLYKNQNFDFVRDLAPVASIGRATFVLAVTPSLPIKTLPEFIAYGKANPGRLYMGSQGIGTTPHVCGELLRMMTGIEFVHVPYRGSLIPDLLAGQVQFYFSPIPQAVGYIGDGRLRALGVTGAKRSTALPDAPAIAGLRGQWLVRHRGAQGHARRDRRQTEQRDRRRARGFQIQGSPTCAWRRAARHDGTRIQGFHHCRSRQMGEGHRVCRLKPE
ncbi:MAG TPA: tripartite tricarboxylate transporter substrate-binding protein [Xanthobacteraceae bacterium]|nr:tripartite tricarboxylate transporter substrate-binding protein [Xanthobacteraceae bacterium]